MTGPSGADEAGSASVLALGVIAMVIVLVSLTVALGSVLTARHRVASAADAAALAAADTVRGLVTGFPCERAQAVAAAHALAVSACRIDGFIAEVAVGDDWLGLAITVRARAGPRPGSD